MNKEKESEKTNPENEALFVSPEGIKCMETAIENLEQVQKELEKVAKGKPAGGKPEKTPKQ